MQKRDTLVCYLFDELCYYEEGHGDALRPIPRELNQSFLGEHAENHPAPKQEVRAIMQELIETYHATGQAGTVVCHGEHNHDSPHIAHTPTPPEPPITPPDHRGDQSMPHNLRIPTLPKKGPLDG